jgi:hypothetical protein
MRHCHGHRLYISHRWNYSPQYRRLVNLLDKDPYFAWCNYSVCELRPFPSLSNRQLEAALCDQIKRAQVVLIAGGMETHNSKWMKKEIAFARERKPVIWIRPRGASLLPAFRREVADAEVGWSTSSIVEAVECFSALRNQDADVW